MMPPALHPVLRLALVLSMLAPVDSLDREVQRAVQSWRRPALEGPMQAASGIRRKPILIAGLVGLTLVSVTAGPATAGAIVGVLVPVNVVVEGLKWTVNRPRPDGDRRRANSSFPSSHAANVAALALVIGRRWRRVAIAGWLVAAVVAFSRMYLNRHFLSDVVLGVAIGVGIGWLTFRWMRSRGWTWEPRP